MNEHSFTRAVLNKLPDKVHVQSMTSASLTHNGTPDRYLDFQLDLWVEFKWWASTPRVLDTGRMLSDLQKRWLQRRFDAGGNACVMVGFPYERRNVGVLFTTPQAWLSAHAKQEYLPWIRSIPELSSLLLDRVTAHDGTSQGRCISSPQHRRLGEGPTEPPSRLDPVRTTQGLTHPRRKA